jgi:hypothetical protein
LLRRCRRRFAPRCRREDACAYRNAILIAPEIPFAAWRVHATAADWFARRRNKAKAEAHRARRDRILRELAASLPETLRASMSA